MTGGRAVARLLERGARPTTIAYALVLLAVALIQPIGYRRTYPTPADRERFAATLGDDAATRVLYGTPHDLLTVGGYVSWRVGGILVVAAALWALLAATRALRGEEDAGRRDLVQSGIVERRAYGLAALAVVAAGTAVLWIAAFAGLVAGGLPADGSAYLALAIVSAAPVMAGVGAVAGQLAQTRQGADRIGLAVLAVAWLLRVASDSSPSLDLLRWLTPFGWSAEMRAFTGARPLVVLIPALAAVTLIAVAALLDARRDLGTGLLTPHDRRPPRLVLLGGPGRQALRSEAPGLVVWCAGLAAFCALLGVLSASVADAIPERLREQLDRLGVSDVITPAGYLSFVFLIVIVALAAMGSGQIAAARREEASGRLETMLAQPAGRRAWLAGRVAIAVAAVGAGALVSALGAWAGARSQDAAVGLGGMVGAAANCLPATLLFLGVGAVALAVVPRAAVAVAYGAVAVSFLWEIVAPVLGLPDWALSLSPLHHVALVPAQAWDAADALGLAAAGAGALALALVLFGRRDLTGA